MDLRKCDSVQIYCYETLEQPNVVPVDFGSTLLLPGANIKMGSSIHQLPHTIVLPPAALVAPTFDDVHWPHTLPFDL